MSVSVITGLCPSLMAQARSSAEGNIATVLSIDQGGCGVINMVFRAGC